MPGLAVFEGSFVAWGTVGLDNVECPLVVMCLSAIIKAS
jgi:hypothetical protein